MTDTVAVTARLDIQCERCGWSGAYEECATGRALMYFDGITSFCPQCGALLREVHAP